MPTFDFLCQKCGHVFEHRRPFGSAEQPSCPDCGSKKTEKQIAPPAIQFKGTGFYKTDSGQKSAPKKEIAEPKESKETKEKPAPERPKEKKASDASSSSSK